MSPRPIPMGETSGSILEDARPARRRPDLHSPCRSTLPPAWPRFDGGRSGVTPGSAAAQPKPIARRHVLPDRPPALSISNARIFRIPLGEGRWGAPLPAEARFRSVSFGPADRTTALAPWPDPRDAPAREPVATDAGGVRRERRVPDWRRKPPPRWVALFEDLP